MTRGSLGDTSGMELGVNQQKAPDIAGSLGVIASPPGRWSGAGVAVGMLRGNSPLANAYDI